MKAKAEYAFCIQADYKRWSVQSVLGTQKRLPGGFLPDSPLFAIFMTPHTMS